MIRRIAAAAARLALGAGPLARRRERAARTAVGMPVGHPELITRELSRAQEELLAGLCARLWPSGEYAAIIRDTRPDGGP